jgi:nucleoid-associated protein YgaU
MNRSIRFGLMTIALALPASLRADDKAASPTADDQVSLKADNKQLSDELAAAWKETADLKAKVSQLTGDNDALSQKLDAAKGELAAKPDAADLKAKVDQLTADNAALGQKLDAAKGELAAKPDAAAPGSSDSSQQIADLQDKLATSLRSFSVIQDENADLKAQLDKLTADNATISQQLDAAHSSNASLQVQAAATSQIDPLRTELRQAQDETSSLATENAALRTRIAIQSPGPGASRPTPLRPNSAAAVAAATPEPAAAAATPPPAARTYVVVEGDTLTKISRKFYGNSGRWQEILKANHDILKDEKSLVVGSTLKIP